MVLQDHPQRRLRRNRLKVRLLAVFLFPSLPLFAQFPPQIKNVVILIQENRTPDNLFHFPPPACPFPADPHALSACTPVVNAPNCYAVSPCGLSNRSGSIVPVPLKASHLYGGVDPDHTHRGFEQMCDP